ncbi:hypothetical protein CSOJ01_15477 [Colletotrichum sojae]|uniref:Uncharacterized protein n=1 Tax=Colletotrichum sojae TaxID=2175907 RepID=A0A8H6IMZ7_9PEZI|nr:hypothetical protein CSOJ01_15477 [Colletotrichum sojae]
MLRLVTTQPPLESGCRGPRGNYETNFTIRQQKLAIGVDSSLLPGSILTQYQNEATSRTSPSSASAEKDERHA